MGSLGSDYGSSLRIAYAKNVYRQHLLGKYQETHPGETTLPASNRHIPNPREANGPTDDVVPQHNDRVCIIGAGAAGLQTAILLHESGYKNIDILEASDRAGGRMFTHFFPDTGDKCKHNYCDIGAMRIPDIKRMKATFDLIKKLGLNDKLEEYYYQIPEDQKHKEPNLWGFESKKPEGDKLEKALNNFFDHNWGWYNFRNEDNFEDAFQRFVDDGLDTLSTRTWLMTQAQPRFSYDETVFAESSDTSTGLLDQAMLETICDYVDFKAAENVPWYRLEGGMKTIVDAMVAKVTAAEGTTITYNNPVVALQNNEAEETITVTTSDGKSTKYAAVFSTTALPCLQRMDISELGLPQEILTGIRTLGYDRATKVAIKFSRAWWRDYLEAPGGISSTDLPISKIVYPSWKDDPAEPSVLLASYSWAQDATRMGALFTNSGPNDAPDKNALVVTQCLENIAQIWKRAPGIKDPPTVEKLRDMYVDHFAYAWSHDKHQGGAYALFAPGQFQNIYPSFQALFCQDKFIISGEALSAEHAWISGALNSAYMSVMRWLLARGNMPAQIHLKASHWGGGKAKHPPEMDEELLYWSKKLGDGKDGK